MLKDTKPRNSETFPRLLNIHGIIEQIFGMELANFIGKLLGYVNTSLNYFYTSFEEKNIIDRSNEIIELLNKYTNY